jgi:hypothetical protein
MKTTLDLPSALVDEVKKHAFQSGVEVDDAAADLLRKGLASSAIPLVSGQRPVIKRHPQTGLPYIECRRTSDPSEELTPERVAELLQSQEVVWHEEASR